jgi:hypothetical protein
MTDQVPDAVRELIVPRMTFPTIAFNPPDCLWSTRDLVVLPGP